MQNRNWYIESFFETIKYFIGGNLKIKRVHFVKIKSQNINLNITIFSCLKLYIKSFVNDNYNDTSPLKILTMNDNNNYFYINLF